MTLKLLSVSAAAAAFALALPASAAATSLSWHVRYDSSPSSQSYSRGYDDARRIARDNGYREGLHHGEEAARHRRAFDLNREKDYRNADEGYKRSYGSREEYREAYRGGFAEGYRAAYDRYSYRVRGGAYYGPRGDDGYRLSGSVAVSGPGVPVGFRNGVNDGHRKGLDDLRHHRYPDVNRQGWYRSGTRGYHDRYGSKVAYRLDYRRGFDQGYEQAFGR